MGFVPMDLSPKDSATHTDGRHAFELAPVATAELFAQSWKIANGFSDSDRFDFADRSDKLKIHNSFFPLKDRVALSKSTFI